MRTFLYIIGSISLPKNGPVQYTLNREYDDIPMDLGSKHIRLQLVFGGRVTPQKQFGALLVGDINNDPAVREGLEDYRPLTE